MELHALIEKEFRLLPAQKMALQKLGLKTIEDMIFNFPLKYEFSSESKTVNTLTIGEEVTLYGKISGLKLSKAFIKKIPMAEATIEDTTGKIKAVWFNQPYIAKMLKEGSLVRVVGKVTERKGESYLANPEIENIEELPIDAKGMLFAKAENKNENTESELFSFPVYAESRGITSRWFYYALKRAFTSGVLDYLADPIPEHILKQYNLPSLRTSLIWIHTPKREEDALSARKRFAFEEIFFIQLQKQRERLEYEANGSFIIEKNAKEIAEFTKRFPFEATGAQKRAIETILSDFKNDRPMSRLLEGDVGSGKTAVAATSAYAVVTTRPKGQDYGTLQIAYMAPTEILAGQHFESFIQYFSHLPISIALITGSGCKKYPSKTKTGGWTNISRPQLLKWVASGEISILIGTHALIQKTVQFKNLAYIIIDEQHRFGTKQRQKLARKVGIEPEVNPKKKVLLKAYPIKTEIKKTIVPHFLSMTATPIPRTLALTIYGDLDLTLLDEMPAGRKPIITEVVVTAQMNSVYEKMREQLKLGRQAYVICPRIDEPDPLKEMALNAKSVVETSRVLQEKVFPEYRIALIHGKLKPDEKDQIMKEFTEKRIDILVATSVIEVGVNVPNATVILIEGGERFGLAQLHQLRGRVIRSNHQAYCFIVNESKSKKSVDRLKAIMKAKNGFELAELDLEQRGEGGLAGKKQWGLSDLGMEAIRNIKMVEAARFEAGKLISQDSELLQYPLLNVRLAQVEKNIHFE
jgi:ATP-dependent DNA helicase RecG